MSDNESRIRSMIEKRAATLETGDAKAFLAYNAPEVVQYTLAPPLRQVSDPRDPGPLERWLATFEAPPRREVTRLEIVAGADVAYATSIDSLTAIPTGTTQPFTLWHRVTLGLRRIDGEWLITHEHQSVPFEMDGSLRASVDLQP